MEDAARPSESAFRAMYERGYRTWAALWQEAVEDESLGAADNPLQISLLSAFPDHPYFPESLILDKSFSNVATVSGRTTWTTTSAADCCDLPSFQEEVIMQVAWNHPTEITLRHDQRIDQILRSLLPEQDNHHFPILFLAWAYILSARWAELIPGAKELRYNEDVSTLASAGAGYREEQTEQDSDAVVVDVGDVDDDDARWWTAVLSTRSGWVASIINDKGATLYSPWSIKITSEASLTLLTNPELRFSTSTTKFKPATFTKASQYLSEYCRHHNVSEQSEAALASVLLIPMAKLDGATINLPFPRTRSNSLAQSLRKRKALPPQRDDIQQLDRLLTLSCNPSGVKSLLSSIFFEPGVDCNIYGAWLQGTFTFLDSEGAKDPYLRLRAFMWRDPGLALLWLGAFITGADARCIRDARAGWWKVNLSSAAWTKTHVSFIQEGVPKPTPEALFISRADEGRLLYLAHGPSRTVPPLFPFPPFGSTAMTDLGLDVRQHLQCPAVHRLGYGGFTWNCEKDRRVTQGGGDASVEASYREKFLQECQPGQNDSIAIDYDGLDIEDDETSEIVTRNIFEWLRGDDGFPGAERAIRQHEWIDGLDTDDDEPIQGDVRSVAGENLGGWLLGVATARSRCSSL